MKSYKLLILLASALVATTCAKQPDNTCVFEGTVYEMGEEFFKPGQCLRYECMSNQVLMAEGCPTLEPRPNCTVTAEDNSKQFPGCCPQYKCDKGVNCFFGGKNYKYTEEFTVPGQCAKFLCSEIGILQNMCAPKDPRPNCTITAVDKSKKFPNCCPDYKCDENPGCYLDGKTYKTDEIFFKPGQCQRFRCAPDGEIRVTSCQEKPPRPHCTITAEDNSKQYPECCPEYKCDENATCYLDGKSYRKDEEFFRPDQCHGFTCNPDGQIIQSSCPPLASIPGCNITAEDNSKQFPQCCPDYKCDEDVGCFINDNYYKKNEEFFFAGQCKKFVCAGGSAVNVATCGPKMPRPNCSITAEDYSKPFPSCCPQYKCDEEPACRRDGNNYKKHEKFVKPGQCKQFVCFGNDVTGQFNCPQKKPRPNCTITAIDNSKVFPKCCPQYVCGNDKDVGCDYDGKHYKIGEEFLKPGQCSKFKCYKNGEMRTEICPPTDPRPNCTLTAIDNSKQFPECCPQYKCEEEVACHHEGKNYKLDEAFVKPGQCTQFVCFGNDMIGQHSCLPITPRPNCTITPRDDSKPFPKCCPQYECDEEEVGCNLGSQHYKAGEEFLKPGQCSKFVCIQNSEFLQESCPPTIPRSNCTLSAIDKTKQFPECCPQYECGKEETCYHDGKNYKKNEVIVKPGQCKQFVCFGNDDVGQYPCAPLKPLPNCEITAEDNSQLFPKCCPEYKCS